MLRELQSNCFDTFATFGISLTLHIDNIKMYGLVSSDDYT